MNRIDRLFGILLKLQQRKHVRSKELATVFEVSERTIFRDIAALTELGVPITTDDQARHCALGDARTRRNRCCENHDGRALPAVYGDDRRERNADVAL
jgi:hypothetical protein